MGSRLEEISQIGVCGEKASILFFVISFVFKFNQNLRLTSLILVMSPKCHWQQLSVT